MAENCAMPHLWLNVKIILCQPIGKGSLNHYLATLVTKLFYFGQLGKWCGQVFDTSVSTITS
jgi:hypothetical protein